MSFGGVVECIHCGGRIICSEDGCICEGCGKRRNMTKKYKIEGVCIKWNKNIGTIGQELL